MIANVSLNTTLKTRKQLILSAQTKHPDDSKVVFFIAGHKCGSTTLATYLKHDPKNWKVWDPNGQFMDGGKEFCWAEFGTSKEQFWKHFRTHGSKMETFALDACPRATETKQFERMVKTFPSASYLMLVRDPVDRFISDMNVELEKVKGNRSIDDLMRQKVTGTKFPLAKRHIRRSMFGIILQNALSVLPRKRILIIPNQDLKLQPQATVDKVMMHIGAKQKNVTLVESNKRKDSGSYQIPSKQNIEWLHDTFYTDWELFKNISGIYVETIYM